MYNLRIVKVQSYSQNKLEYKELFNRNIKQVQSVIITDLIERNAQ
jgi:hypothetical protein